MRADLGVLAPLFCGGAGTPRSLTPDLRPYVYLRLCCFSTAAPWEAAQAPTADELLVGARLQSQVAVLKDERSLRSSEWVEGGGPDTGPWWRLGVDDSFK